jgi:hypothetical protein
MKGIRNELKKPMNLMKDVFQICITNSVVLKRLIRGLEMEDVLEEGLKTIIKYYY